MNTGRINIHAHIFNLEAVMTPFSIEIVKKRVAYEIEHSNKIPKVLRKQLTKILGDLAEDLLHGITGLNERAILERLLSRIAGQETVAGLLSSRGDSLPSEVRAVVAGRVQDLLLRQARRALSWISGRLRKEQSVDYRESDLHDLFETLRIGGRPDMIAVTDWLLDQLDPDDLVVALMMDLTQGDDADTAAFHQQLVGSSRIARFYPGRVLPFVKVNTLRTGKLVLDGANGPIELEGHFDIMKHALENLGFVGVKLYPSLGYAPDSDAMMKVFEYCEPRGIPLLMHCNRGGFVTSETSSRNANPDHWIGILDRFPKLKICFAHFGGGGGLTGETLAPTHWGTKILELMEHEGVYCDIAFHRAAMDSDGAASRYKKNLGEILRHPTRGARVLFGTDFWLMRTRLTEAHYWQFYEDLLGTEHFEQIAATNPRRFLGLSADGQNEALDAYFRFVAGASEPLRAAPPTWLLEGVENHVDGAARGRLEEAGSSLLPSPRLRIPGWRQVLDDLGGETLADRPSWRAEVARSTTAFGSSALELNAGAELSVETLDASSESDADGILHPPATPSATELAAVLDPEPGKAWLKYRLAATLGAEAKGQVEKLGLDFEVGADKTLIFTDYRVHPPSRRALDAVVSDLASPRLALDRVAVLRLQHNEAVSLSQRGTLRGKATLALRDVFTSGLNTLSEILGARQTLRVRVDLAASLTVKARVTDDFKVVFARRGGSFKVAVRKQDTNGRSLRAEIVAGVQFDDPEALRSVLGQLLAQSLAEPEAELARLRERSEATLDSDDRDRLERLQARLTLQGLEAVQERLDALEEDLRNAIETIAEQRASLGFSYEYSRIESDTTIFEASLDPNTLSELHEQLVQGDLNEALDRIREGVPGITLDRYLRLEELNHRRAWGFTLGGLGRFDVKERRLAIQRSLDAEAVKLSFLGSRSYTDPRNERDLWKADLRAEMPGFLPAGELALGAASDDPSPPFRYGLALALEWLPKKLGKTELRAILDVAATWGVLPDSPEAIDDQVAAFEREGLLGESVRLELELTLDSQSLAAVLDRANDTHQVDRWARALAVAMPYSRRKANATIDDRRGLYAPLWKAVLEESEDPNFVPNLFDLARAARRRLQKEGFPAADEFDSSGQWQTKPTTFGGLLSLNDPIPRWRTFCLGLRSLGSALGDTQQLGDIDRVQRRLAAIHRQLEAFWNQSHHVRAVGAYLRRCADEAGLGAAGSSLAAPVSLSATQTDDSENLGLVLART